MLALVLAVARRFVGAALFFRSISLMEWLARLRFSLGKLGGLTVYEYLVGSIEYVVVV